MSEGDTIRRAARTLGHALTGSTVRAVSGHAPRLRSAGVERLTGQTVQTVEARGKHLLIRFAPMGLTLHTHLMVSGSWHLYRPGQPWRKPARRASAVIEVDDWLAVCFAAPVCELLTSRQITAHPVLASLGPDATAEGTDLEEARCRLDARGGWSIGDALLDQRVLAGVGNVYKCEVLFMHGVDPWVGVGELAGPTRDALLATAVRLLKANASPDAGPRTTTGLPSPSGQHGRLFVYGRARRPCRRCGTAIRVARQGRQARLTYWCPRCQPRSVQR